MKKLIRHTAPAFFILLSALIPCHAAEVTIPNTFQSGSTAVAAQVNGNFSAVKNAVDDNDSRVAALEALVATLSETVAAQQTRIAELEESEVMALGSYITVDEDSDSRGAIVQLDGVNLQITNGLGSTGTTNGLGNLIIGYDEISTEGTRYACSNGIDQTSALCDAGGGIWDNSHKSGSHYLVLGSENSYSQFGGMVAGFRNFAIRDYATVTGGYYNIATGLFSSVSGGIDNKARGANSSISGGDTNYANGDYSSISGGHLNSADGTASNVSGGYMNTADGAYSSVSGGYNNTAGAHYSTVGGGASRTAPDIYDWAAGLLHQEN